MSGCRIGKIRLKKTGLEIRIIPSATHSHVRYTFPWGEVSIRTFDGMPIENRDVLYLLRCAEDEVLHGD